MAGVSRVAALVTVMVMVVISGCTATSITGTTDVAPTAFAAPTTGPAATTTAIAPAETTAIAPAETTASPEATTPPETTLALEAGSSRADPVPVGTAVRLRDWELTVVSFNPEGTAAVMEENSATDPPAAGREFMLIEVSLTYVGVTSSKVFADVRFTVVGDAGVAYGPYDDTCGIIPNELDEYTEAFTGGTITGNLCYAVPAEEAESLVLIADEDFGDTRHFMALR